MESRPNSSKRKWHKHSREILIFATSLQVAVTPNLSRRHMLINFQNGSRNSDLKVWPMKRSRKLSMARLQSISASGATQAKSVFSLTTIMLRLSRMKLTYRSTLRTKGHDLVSIAKWWAHRVTACEACLRSSIEILLFHHAAQNQSLCAQRIKPLWETLRDPTWMAAKH